MRKPIIAGNWKMNMTPSEAKVLIAELKPLVANAKCDVVVCPPYVCIPTVAELIKGSNIRLGAQNCHFEAKGAYTGEISLSMLKELQVEFVIIGHSERRQYFAETDASVNKKVTAALAAGLTPIMCCGETLAQRENGETDSFVASQIVNGLRGLTAVDIVKIVIAYEPIWAIGTGKTATNGEANATIGVIRKALVNLFGTEAAEAVRIQYGGSMSPKNASELMAMPEIDGGLIGGAALKAEDFSKVVNF
jgi:triosephosphate isomerase